MDLAMVKQEQGETLLKYMRRFFDKHATVVNVTDKEVIDLLQDGLYLSYGPPWAHYLGGYQDRLLGGPLGLPGLRYTAPEGVEHKDYGGEVLG
jgi:hypothetical protein